MSGLRKNTQQAKKLHQSAKDRNKAGAKEASKASTKRADKAMKRANKSFDEQMNDMLNKQAR